MLLTLYIFLYSRAVHETVYMYVGEIKFTWDYIILMLPRCQTGRCRHDDVSNCLFVHSSVTGRVNTNRKRLVDGKLCRHMQ